MEKLKDHFNIFCISFAWILFLICTINYFGIVESFAITSLPVKIIYQVYLMCFLVQVLMFFTNKISIENTFLQILVGILDVFVVIIPLGLYFDLFDITFRQISIVSFMNISTYVVVFVTYFLKNKSDALYINSKLNKKKERKR